MTHYDFRGRVVFITGGTKGIGLATACAFARAGASVALTGRDEDAGREACAKVAEASGGEGAVLFLRADVRDERQIVAAVAATQTRHGRLDYAFNNAGVAGDMATLEATDQAVWDDVMAVNARGVWLAMRHEIPAMLKNGGGAIVNMSSIFGQAGKPAHHAYVASKHAVVGLTRSVALEYATRGVRVNAVCPGATATSSLQQAAVAFPALVDALVAEHPMRRLAREEEVAAAVLWLCSGDAGFVTGTSLAVDGGFLAA
jgi:NAD(P)-dependent dehydrogenase (short-subunit alcohol dehydrogenase family)